jgi:hypothetical protein
MFCIHILNLAYQGDDVDQGEALDVEDEADAALATTADHQRHLKKVSARVKSGDVFDKIHEHERFVFLVAVLFFVPFFTFFSLYFQCQRIASKTKAD